MVVVFGESRILSLKSQLVKSPEFVIYTFIIFINIEILGEGVSGWLVPALKGTLLEIISSKFVSRFIVSYSKI
jgi:hypothetical protein